MRDTELKILEGMYGHPSDPMLGLLSWTPKRLGKLLSQRLKLLVSQCSKSWTFLTIGHRSLLTWLEMIEFSIGKINVWENYIANTVRN